ncbi:hypothetical protein BDW02DRAFT_645663 [Decorospora gaudefroyi]|uniref:Uncharacterized protein n=1 Tax=Decorospora gaudefroyi TaxID=184978 RepID=A0A6A5KNI1_9PLEO|nr:hypothetical protein BDW02DRAFT_645663 [Decorospora gaudefroyi]
MAISMAILSVSSSSLLIILKPQHPTYRKHVSSLALQDAIWQHVLTRKTLLPLVRSFQQAGQKNLKVVTANRFGVLAELSQSPTEPNRAFDLIPTSTGGTRRWGKRNGDPHKSQRARHEKRKARKNESISALCKKIAALRLDEDATSRTSKANAANHDPHVAGTNPTSSFQSARPYWAPQFRPNRLPTKSETMSTPTKTEENSNFRKRPQPCLSSTKLSSACRETPYIWGTEPRPDSPSAFLACPDITERYPSQPRFTQAKTKKRSNEFCAPLSLPPPTHAQKAAVSAARCALALRRFDPEPLRKDDTLNAQQPDAFAFPSLVQTSGHSFRAVDFVKFSKDTSPNTLAIYALERAPGAPSNHPAMSSMPRQTLTPPMALDSQMTTDPSPFSSALPPTASATSAAPLRRPDANTARAWKNLFDSVDIFHQSSTITSLWPTPSIPSNTNPYDWQAPAVSYPVQTSPLFLVPRKPVRPPAQRHHWLISGDAKDCCIGSSSIGANDQATTLIRDMRTLRAKLNGPEESRSTKRYRYPVDPRAHNVDSIFAPKPHVVVYEATNEYPEIDTIVLPAIDTTVLPAKETTVLPAKETTVLPAIDTTVLPAIDTPILPAAIEPPTSTQTTETRNNPSTPTHPIEPTDSTSTSTSTSPIILTPPSQSSFQDIYDLCFPPPYTINVSSPPPCPYHTQRSASSPPDLNPEFESLDDDAGEADAEESDAHTETCIYVPPPSCECWVQVQVQPPEAASVGVEVSPLGSEFSLVAEEEGEVDGGSSTRT